MTELIPKHSVYWPHSPEPASPQFLEDTNLLGERVAYALDDEALWGAPGIIYFMAAPGAPWEGR
jgi:hypothetical protein